MGRTTQEQWAWEDCEDSHVLGYDEYDGDSDCFPDTLREWEELHGISEQEDS